MYDIIRGTELVEASESKDVHPKCVSEKRVSKEVLYYRCLPPGVRGAA